MDQSPRRVRHVNLRSDEFIAGISGELSPAELGVYWMVCLLCYSHGGHISADPKTLRAKFRAGPANAAIASILDTLIERGKVYREGQTLGVRRVDEELALSRRRIVESKAHGRRGGRPSKKTNGLDYTDPLHHEKLTHKHTNGQTQGDVVPKKESFINTSELGSSAREARSAPLEPAAPSEPDIVAVEIVVANLRSELDPGARTAAIEQSKRDAWLNNLAAWVGTAEQLDFNDRMVAWQAIEDARIAGCRRATPPHIRTALDRMSKLRLQQRRAA